MRTLAAVVLLAALGCSTEEAERACVEECQAVTVDGPGMEPVHPYVDGRACGEGCLCRRYEEPAFAICAP